MQPAASQEHDLSAVFEALEDGVLKIDRRGVFVLANAAAERMLHVSREQMLGRMCTEVELPFDICDDANERLAHDADGRCLRVMVSDTGNGERVVQIRDITRRVSAEADLHRSEDFLQAVLDNIDAGIVACDETGTLRIFNDAARVFHGISEAPVGADEWASRYSLYEADGITPLSKEQIPLYRAFSGEKVRQAEMVIAPANGPRRSVLASGRAIIGRDGRNLGAVVAMQDISHRKHSGARIRDALRQFRTLFNDGPLSYHEVDRTGIIRRVNRAECRLLELRREEIVGKPAWAFVPEEERERFRIYLLERLSGLWPLRAAEREIITASGARVLVELHENLIHDGNGAIAGIRTAMLDVSERKHRQMAEAESAEIRSILERIGDAYMAFDSEWRYTYVNGKAAELALKPASELIGKCVWDEFPESVHTTFFAELQRSMREQIPIEFDNYFAPLGKYFENTVYPSPSGVGVFYRDVTARRRTEEDLKRRSIELARKNAELATFASVVSHDLQEPLRMIGGYAALLSRRYADALDADAKEFFTFMTRGVERMDRLIKDLLALCRLEEATDSRLTKVDLGHVTEFVRGNLSLAIEDSGAVIETHDLPVVQYHPTHMIQVLQNLIANALKYRSAAQPHVVIRGERIAGAWQISLSDNGIGFDMRYAEQIFRPFKRLQRTDDGGSGIGLAICKKVVESRGGRMWVESSPGAGSIFYFTVPDALPVSD
jgi:PAS domain S-box-containing protein